MPRFACLITHSPVLQLHYHSLEPHCRWTEKEASVHENRQPYQPCKSGREICLANPLRKKTIHTHTESNPAAEWLKYTISFHFTSHSPDFPKNLICINHIHNPEKSKFSCKRKGPSLMQEMERAFSPPETDISR